MAEWVKGTIIQVEHWPNQLFRILMSAPIAPFRAGQFAKLALDIADERVQRAYSYVNPPSAKQLEFYLVRAEQGKLTPHLDQLRPGDTLYITREANGFFTLDEIPDCQTLWMFATGTAIGPYLSILQEKQGLSRFDNLVLVHATRYAADLNYLPLMKRLQAEYQGKLRIQCVVSRETVTDTLTGRIPALIETGALQAAVGLAFTPQTSHVMLCGNPQMVRDTQHVLKSTLGMEKHLRRKPGHITSEHYW